jgi:hypothetical protein
MSPSPTILMGDSTGRAERTTTLSPQAVHSRCQRLEQVLHEERLVTEQLRQSNALLQTTVNLLCERFKTLSVEYAAHIQELEENLLVSEKSQSSVIPSSVAVPDKDAGTLIAANRELHERLRWLEQELGERQRTREDGAVAAVFVEAATQTAVSYAEDLFKSTLLIDLREKQKFDNRGVSDGPDEPRGHDVDGTHFPIFPSVEEMKQAVRDLERINADAAHATPVLHLPARPLVSSVDPTKLSPALQLTHALQPGTAGSSSAAQQAPFPF